MGRGLGIVVGATVAAALAGSASAAAPETAPGEAGLVARWRFDERGGRTAADSAGGDNNGSLKGDPPAARVRGGSEGCSLGFFAGGQEVTGPDRGLPSGTAAGSIGVWFLRPKGVADKVLFVYGRRERGRARGLWLVSEKRLCFYFWGDPRDLHADVPGGIAAETWHHAAATYDGRTARLYCDGALIGKVSCKLDTALAGVFHVGRNLVEDHRDFIGLIGETAVYSRALSAAEVRALYERRAAALVARAAADVRAYRAIQAGAARKAEQARKARAAKAIARTGVKEILFAIRQADGDNHWYANFGYHVVDPNRTYYHPGGWLCRLDLATGRVMTLLADPQGGVRDPQMHYDGRKVLFSYRKGGRPYYHLYEMNIDGSGLRQLTDGPYDDFEPAYLPDGGIVFCSSRCRRWVPCYYSQVAVLHRCDGDGKGIRQLSANVEHENTPWVLPDGRILYQRWEYVDRSQVGFHHLWTMNPDGTGQMVYFGNMHPNTVMIDAKPIPGTSRVVASFSPGHGRNEHRGAITIVDPRSGPDAREMARPIGPRGKAFRDPYPLSDDAFLVAGDTTIYLMDRTGGLLKLYELPAEYRKGRMLVHEPRPVRGRARERVIPPRVDLTKPTGHVVLEDIYAGRNMTGIERGSVRKLLVLEILPKPYNMFSGMEPLSYGGTFLLERVLGTVPVEADGSAHAELPAMRPLFFAALDANDVAIKRMQSFLTVQPGESLSCVGCHEDRPQTPRSARLPLAVRRAPSEIEPIPDVPDVLDFPRDIQPILDRHCVACHDYRATQRGGPMAGGIILSGDRGPMFSHSYYMLTIDAEFADGRNLRKSNYPPRTLGSSASPLLSKLDGGHYGVEVSARERATVRLWIDSGAAYPGTYAALGAGSIGDYSGLGRPDLKWPSVRRAKEVMARRCASCHKGALSLPTSPSDNKGLVPWGEGPMNRLADRQSQRYNPTFRFNRHALYNLTRPAMSLLLLAPLSRRAGGFGMAKRADGRVVEVFTSQADPDYQALLLSIRKAQEYLARIKRFDMAGFRPRPEYVREMRRFGILPPDHQPSDPIDVYAIDRKYWESFWYRPVAPR